MKKIFSLFFVLLFSCYLYSQGTWSYVSSLPTSPDINSITVVGNETIFTACTGGKVYKSTDGGATWELKNGGLPTGDLYGISAVDANNCWVGTGTGAIYRTTDGGTTWTQQIAVSGSFINGIKMFDINRGFYTGDPTGSGQPYQNRFTTNGGTNWYLSSGAPIAGNEFGVINALDITDTNRIWIGSANLDASATTAKIYKTTSGVLGTWSSSNVPGTGGTAGLYYQAIAMVDNNNGMAGSNGTNIVKTTDGGITWTATNLPPGTTSFAAINMTAFRNGSNTVWLSINVGTAVYQLFKTTDFGTSWTEAVLPSQGQTNGVQHMVFVSPTLGYAGGAAGTILKYFDPTPVELTSFIATPSSGNVTLNWKTASELNNRGFEIERNVNNEGWSILSFKPGFGTTTEPREYSYLDDISSLNASSLSYRLKQIDFNGEFEYSDAVNVENIIPANFSLLQNFPNPFNPSTLIKYQLPTDGFVTLKVYNSLGEEVASLVNEFRNAGIYEVNFNAAGLSSGMYYYVLRSQDNQVSVKKMALLK